MPRPIPPPNPTARLMTVRRRAPYRFGARKQRPVCDNCGSFTRLTRRGSHPTMGERYELQVFTCPKCGDVREHVAEESGPATGPRS